MFSNRCKYALKSLTYMVPLSLKEQRVKAVDLAKNAGMPVAFVAKVLSTLADAGVLDSHRGAVGGFLIPKEKLWEVSLYDIIRLMDGDGTMTYCAIGFERCNLENPCPLHQHIFGEREQLRIRLENTKLGDLIPDDLEELIC